jgi:hypothetical protein
LEFFRNKFLLSEGKGALRMARPERYVPVSENIRHGEAGYTLFLVIELLTLIAVLTILILQQIHFVRIRAIREIQRVESRLLAESGITRAEYFLGGGEGHSILWESDGCDELLPNYGAIHLECKRYGLLSKLVSRGTIARTSCTITALAGRADADLCTPALTLTGKVGGLALMNATAIKGTVVLSGGRICRGENAREVHEAGLAVTIKESPSLPFDSSQMFSAVKALANEYKTILTEKKPPTGAAASASQNDSILRTQSPIVNGDCRLDRGMFSERKFAVAGTLTLAGEVKCTGCIFLAEKIVLDGGISDRCIFYSARAMKVAGGRHNSQMFGGDSISVEKKAAFGPLNIFALAREGAADSTAGIRFSPGCRLQGVIICCSDSAARFMARIPSVIFGKGCELRGICMTDGDIDCSKISVIGHLWARSIVTSDGMKAYVNYLFDSRIEEPKGLMQFPLIGKPPLSLYIENLGETYTVRKRSANESRKIDSTRKANNGS